MKNIIKLVAMALVALPVLAMAGVPRDMQPTNAKAGCCCGTHCATCCGANCACSNGGCCAGGACCAGGCCAKK